MPRNLFQKRPGIVVNAPGRLFSSLLTCKIVPPRGAFTRIITVFPEMQCARRAQGI